MKKYYSLYAAAAALLLTACTQDLAQNGEDANDNGRTITFSAQTVSVQDDTRSASLPDALPLTGDGMELWLIPSEEDMVSDVTRGTQINSVEALNNFGVSAYRHGAIPSEKTQNEYLTDNNLKPDFFYNLEATKIADTQKFKLTKDFFWPTDDDVLSFFAYAPYGDENV
ncbi:Fimbrillin-like, partial [Prevotellaceae bacterium HUN156]